mmetsp:Transcript_31519/g.56411  ORF Transcript_31519/g.56411 Transcript_31519/m.56411 type:complete len:241 (-) Transcript_31519:65-787(-)
MVFPERPEGSVLLVALALLATLASSVISVAHGDSSSSPLSCVGVVEWGNCTEGSNVGFRHPTLDLLEAQRVDENSAGVTVDGFLEDWNEHTESRRYSDPEFATLSGKIVTFETLDPAKLWRGPNDFSLHSFMLKWDPEYIYLAVEVMDDVWEPITVGTRCHTNGVQLAFEVGGDDSLDLDGNSALGLVQARRSRELNISRSVLINVGMSAFETHCTCADCDDLKTSGTGDHPLPTMSYGH